jgi:predicted DNA-binding antitoxin AbrB/MazE fold protein
MKIRAIYEHGLFRPIEEILLPDGAEVEFESRVVEESADDTPSAERYVQWLRSRTPEEIEATWDRLLSISRPAAPFPPGKTLSDMVEGKWPGDETDEQVHAALERLS